VARPGPHPPPPPDLAKQELPIVRIDVDWWRIHTATRSALYWGLDPPRQSSERWDSPDRSYGVLYVGHDEFAAFIETLGQNTGIRIIQTADLATRRLSRIVVSRPLDLVPVTGQYLAQMGVDSRLFAADHAIAQQWSEAIYRHPQAPDGVLYPARHDQTRLCAALFDRVQSAVSAISGGRLDDRTNEGLLGKLLAEYKFGLLN